jgi:hypothetical protein
VQLAVTSARADDRAGSLAEGRCHSQREKLNRAALLTMWINEQFSLRREALMTLPDETGGVFNELNATMDTLLERLRHPGEDLAHLSDPRVDQRIRLPNVYSPPERLDAICFVLAALISGLFEKYFDDGQLQEAREWIDHIAHNAKKGLQPFDLDGTLDDLP